MSETILLILVCMLGAVLLCYADESGKHPRISRIIDKFYQWMERQ